MKLAKIRVSLDGKKAMVWFLDKDGIARVANVSHETWSGWTVEYQGKRVINYPTKASAIAGAKKILKNAMTA